ncbi:MAG: DUF5686 family protein, partial [Sphingobacteriia bacterium]
DVDGYFTLRLPSLPDAVVFSYLGYRSDTLYAPFPTDTVFLRLQPESLELEAIQVQAGPNPALRIVEQAIGHRNKHHPRLMPAFNYDSYTKINIRPGPQMRLSRQGDSLMQLSDLLVWETATERHFIYPNRDYEKITGSQVSGLKGIAIPLSPTEIQDISFYTDWVRILDRPYISPLAFSGLRRYQYRLADTLYDGPDTLYVIHYQPTQAATAGLEGEMRIHTDGYALQSITARGEVEQDVPTLVAFELRQQHERIQGRWFPQQLHTELLFVLNKRENDPSKYFQLQARTYLSHIRFEPDTSLDYEAISLELESEAGRRNPQYWQQRRREPLATKDSTTYQTIDSLLSRTPVTWVVRQIDALRLGYMAFGPLYLDLRRVYTLNRVEDSRFGLGLLTNEAWSPAYTLEAWAGYGTGDTRWKYGGGLQLHPFTDPRFRLAYHYDNDLIVTGGNYLMLPERRVLHERPHVYRSSRMLFMSVMDYVKRHQLALHFLSLRNVSHRIGLMQEELQPAYTYRYKEQNRFRFSEVQLEIRWAPGERFRKEGRKRISLGTHWPVLQGRYIQGLAGVLGSSLGYLKLEATLSQQLPLSGWLRMDYQLNAGSLQGELPYPKLYHYHANGEPNFIAEGYAFNTMFFNDFVADHYATGHLHLHLLNRVFPGRRYNPDARLVYNTGWGLLRSCPGQPTGLAAVVPELGFHEAGIALINLLPRPLLKLAPTLQFLGFGLYLRLGPYARPSLGENLAPKIEYRIKF